MRPSPAGSRPRLHIGLSRLTHVIHLDEHTLVPHVQAGLTGIELGPSWETGRGLLRLTGFWNHLDDPILNATLPAPLPDGSTRQRRNAGRARIRGIEALGHPLVADVRGAGLLIGVVLTAPVSAAVAGALRNAGFLVNNCQPDVIRLAPPLILTAEQADAFLAALPAALDSALEAAS